VSSTRRTCPVPPAHRSPCSTLVSSLRVLARLFFVSPTRYYSSRPPVISRKIVEQSQGSGSDKASPFGTPAPGYTATFGSVPNPNAGIHRHEVTTLTISPAEGQVKTEASAEPELEVRYSSSNQRFFCRAVLTPSQPHPYQVRTYHNSSPQPTGGAAVPMQALPALPTPAATQQSAERPSSREYAVSSGAVPSGW